MWEWKTPKAVVEQKLNEAAWEKITDRDYNRFEQSIYLGDGKYLIIGKGEIDSWKKHDEDTYELVPPEKADGRYYGYIAYILDTSNWEKIYLIIPDDELMCLEYWDGSVEYDDYELMVNEVLKLLEN